jgi:hypothetical protein
MINIESPFNLARLTQFIFALESGADGDMTAGRNIERIALMSRHLLSFLTSVSPCRCSQLWCAWLPSFLRVSISNIDMSVDCLTYVFCGFIRPFTRISMSGFKYSTTVSSLLLCLSHSTCIIIFSCHLALNNFCSFIIVEFRVGNLLEGGDLGKRRHRRYY